MTLHSNGSILETVSRFAETRLRASRGTHDWDHTLRVRRLSLHIGRTEGADGRILEIASYLHDVGRYAQDRSKGLVCHAEKGAKMVEPLLQNFAISAMEKENVLHCIRSHRYRGNCRPKTLEAKVLFDADKLDAIGAIGVARAFLFAGELGARLHNPDLEPEEATAYTQEDTGYREFKLKLSKIRDLMLTGEGRRMAEGRHAFMVAFFTRFLEEYDGLK